jgi:hypothetical protein
VLSKLKGLPAGYLLKLSNKNPVKNCDLSPYTCGPFNAGYDMADYGYSQDDGASYCNTGCCTSDYQCVKKNDAACSKYPLDGVYYERTDWVQCLRDNLMTDVTVGELIDDAAKGIQVCEAKVAKELDKCLRNDLKSSESVQTHSDNSDPNPVPITAPPDTSPPEIDEPHSEADITVEGNNSIQKSEKLSDAHTDPTPKENSFLKIIHYDESMKILMSFIFIISFTFFVLYYVVPLSIMCCYLRKKVPDTKSKT